MDNMITAKEVGNFLKISETTVYNLARKRKLPGFRIGKSWRFDMEEIIRMVRAETARTPNEPCAPGRAEPDRDPLLTR